MLKNSRSRAFDGLMHWGCSQCNSKRARKAAKGSARAREKSHWKRDQSD